MNIEPKKSLGQNFLKNKEIIKKIMESADLSAEDFVLEIGPGKGILTEELAKACKKVIAIEIDKNLAEVLRNKFKGNEKIEIVDGNILKANIKEIFSSYELRAMRYKLVANIPYYITSPIIRFFLENKFPPKEMILMVQKEVAERIVAKPGNHSIFSLSVQYYAKPELLFYVSKNDFYPVPEVDSAVIRITHNAKRRTQEENENFFRIIRAGFCAKRKTLTNNLSNSFHLDKKEVEKKLKAVGISPIARAQELAIEDWRNLVNEF